MKNIRPPRQRIFAQNYSLLLTCRLKTQPDKQKIEPNKLPYSSTQTILLQTLKKFTCHSKKLAKSLLEMILNSKTKVEPKARMLLWPDHKQEQEWSFPISQLNLPYKNTTDKDICYTCLIAFGLSSKRLFYKVRLQLSRYQPYRFLFV